MCYRKLGELKKRFSVKALLYFINKYVNLYSFCLINSRAAIAGAIIGLHLVFYNSKNLNCTGALSILRSVHTFS